VANEEDCARSRGDDELEEADELKSQAVLDVPVGPMGRVGFIIVDILSEALLVIEIIDIKVLDTSAILDLKTELDVAVVLSRMDKMYAVRIVVILEINCVLDTHETIIENEAKVARDSGNTMELVNDVTGSVYDNELAPKDGEVVEDSICGRITDTVFVKDDPCEEGKDGDSVMSMAPSDCTAAEDVDENAEVLGLGFVGTD